MSRRMLSVLMLLALVSSVFASNGTQIGTVGAKSTAMGSAFRGLADDWSAVYFNPAGATQFGKWEIGFSAGMIMPRGSYEAYPYPGVPFAGMKSGEVDAEARNFLVPALGIFYKPCEKWTVGLGVYAPNGLGTEWDFYNVPAWYGNANAISKEKESYSDHQVIDIQPTVAYQLTEKLSVGLGLKYTWGTMTLDEVMLPMTRAIIFERYQGALPIAMIDQLLGGIKQVGRSSNSDFDPSRIIVENNLEGSGSAYGASLGLLFKATEKLSIGVCGKYSTDLKLKGDFKLTAGMPDFRPQVGVLEALGQLDPTQAAGLKASFNGTNQTLTDIDDVEADLPLPMTLGLGVAFKPTCRWTLTVDGMWTNWAAWDKIELTQNGKPLNEMGLDWDDTIELGAGFEFLAMKTECKKLFLRLGGYTVDSPVPDETMNPTLLDPATRYVATAGIGLDLGKLSADLAYERVMFDDKDITEYQIGAEGYPMNYAGKYTFSANVITLAFSYSIP